MQGVNSTIRSLRNIARQIALPGETPPDRYPSYPALERTAVVGLNYPTTVRVDEGKKNMLLLARQAAYPLWGSTEKPRQACLYEWSAPKAGRPGGTTIHPDWSTFYFTPHTRVEGTHVGFDADATVWPAGTVTAPFCLLGMDAAQGERPFVYMPTGAHMKVYFSLGRSIPAETVAKLTFLSWTAPGESLEVPVLCERSGNSTEYTIVRDVTFPTSWVRLEHLTLDFPLEETDVPYFGIAFSSTHLGVTGVTSGRGKIGAESSEQRRFLMPLVWPKEAANSAIPWSATRTTATALLGSNVTSAMYKGGTVLCGRINPATTTPFEVTEDTVTTLHPSEKVQIPLQTGVYTYVPPSTDLSDFWDYTSGPTGIFSLMPMYRLDNRGLVNVIFFNPVAQSQRLAITLSLHLEFRTTSTLFPLGVSGTTLETFHQAQLALAKAGFFFENPVHVRSLNWIISGGSAQSRPTYGRRAHRAERVTHPERKEQRKSQPGGKHGPPRSEKKQKQKTPKAKV